jgi:hypothetical protein
MRGILCAAAWTAAFSTLAGCVPITTNTGLSSQDAGTRAAWAMPSELSMASTGSVAAAGTTILAYHSQLGWVRGTSATLATLASPLTPRGGAPEWLVEACRAAIAEAAMPYGVQTVQAVSAGLARRLQKGGLEAPVEIRVLYRRPDSYEVRQAILNCRADANRNIVDARA